MKESLYTFVLVTKVYVSMKSYPENSVLLYTWIVIRKSVTVCDLYFYKISPIFNFFGFWLKSWVVNELLSILIKMAKNEVNMIDYKKEHDYFRLRVGAGRSRRTGGPSYLHPEM